MKTHLSATTKTANRTKANEVQKDVQNAEHEGSFMGKNGNNILL